jgi:beta-galactosidase
MREQHTMNIQKLIFLSFLLAPLAALHAVDFCDGWRFHLEDVSEALGATFDDSAWEVVSIPHPAKIEARVCGKDNNPQWEGICWYRKAITITPEMAGKVVWVRFEGAMNKAVLYANGNRIAENLDGYLPFVADLTVLAKSAGKITLALRLDNNHNPVTGPKPLTMLDFNLYHGLYRPASLIVKPLLHITDEILENKVASGGIFVTYPDVSEKSAIVNAQVHVRNSDTTPSAFSLIARLSDPAGKEVAKKESDSLSLKSGEDRAFALPVTLLQPLLWSPQAPNLYFLDIVVVVKDKVIDHQRLRIGIRRLAFAPGGIVINGKKMFMRGANRHQEYPYVGNALPDQAQYRDAFKIKQAGFDYVRLSHYPQSPAFMDACDELGLITMPAILGWQFNAKTEPFYANRAQSVRELVRRDRNHPSACMWEACLNESGMPPDFIQRLNTAAHEEYPGDQMFTAGWVKGYDIKLSARQHKSTQEFTNITFPAIVSEYGDWEYMAKGNDGLHQDTLILPTGVKETYLMSRQTRGSGEPGLARQAMNFQEAHNEDLGTSAAGDGVWLMFDYNRGYARNLETSGVSDLFRIPKFSYAFYQSQRDLSETVAAGTTVIGGPMVFIASWWTDKSPLTVRVYSNAEEVELFLNNKSLGRRKPDTGVTASRLLHPPFTFLMPKFEPGELHAIAYATGKPVAEHRVKTPGAAKTLSLSADLSGRPARAGGDLLFIYARAMDEAGTCVPTFKNPVTFTVEGDAKLIGENPISSEAGIAAVLVKTGTSSGSITLVATSGTLTGKLTIIAK